VAQLDDAVAAYAAKIRGFTFDGFARAKDLDGPQRQAVRGCCAEMVDTAKEAVKFVVAVCGQ
jgi:hypothetical protein